MRRREEIKLRTKRPLRQVIAGVDPECILCAVKTLNFEDNEKGFDVRCRIELAPQGARASRLWLRRSSQFTVGLEMVINLLAPNVPDRYFEFSGAQKASGMERRGRGLASAPCG